MLPGPLNSGSLRHQMSALDRPVCNRGACTLSVAQLGREALWHRLQFRIPRHRDVDRLIEWSELALQLGERGFGPKYGDEARSVGAGERETVSHTVEFSIRRNGIDRLGIGIENRQFAAFFRRRGRATAKSDAA